MNFKRIISAVILCSMLPFCAYAESSDSGFEVITTNENTEQTTQATAPEKSEYLDIAIALGLLPKDGMNEKILTRGDCARIVSRVVYGVDAGSTDTPFSDVTSSNANSGAVAMANQWRIMVGYDDGTFKPDKEISKSEFLKTMVTLIGYAVYANGKTNSGETYERIAEQNGITKGAILRDNNITYEQCARVLYNLFSIKVFNTDFSRGKLEVVKTDDTILDFMNIKTVDGIVAQNDISSLYDDSGLSKGYALIGDEQVLCGESNIDSLLGFNVKAYIDFSDDNDSPVVIYVKPYKTNITEVDLHDIDSTTNVFADNILTYYQGKKTKKIKTEAVLSVIYNGVYTSTRDVSLLNNGFGMLTALDNNDDGKYDVLRIEKGTDYLVDSVNKSGTLITVSDKFNKKIEIDTDESDYDLIIVDKNGTVADPESIAEWNVLTVYDSKISNSSVQNRKVKIVISADSTSGRVSSIDINDERIAKIDGEEYYISYDYISTDKISMIKSGDEGTFVLNHRGDICGFRIDTEYKLSRQYGILVKIYFDEIDEETVFFKIYTQNDEFIKVKSAKTLRIDDETRKNEMRYKQFMDVDGSTIRQLIRFKLDENEDLKIIDTAQDKTTRKSDTFRCLRDISEPKARWRSGLKSFDNLYNISSNTIRFSIPSDPTNDDEYSTTISLQEDKSYNIGVYVEENPFECTVLLMKDAKSIPITATEVNILQKINQVCNEDDEIVYEVSVLGSGGEKSLYAEMDTQGISDLNKGDVFAYSTDGKGYISSILRLYDFENDKGLYTDYGFAAEDRIVVGKAYERYGSFFSVATDEITADTKNMTLQSWNAELYPNMIYVYDAENKEARIGSINDIKPYSIFGSDCSTILMADKTAWAKGMVIINR